MKEIKANKEIKEVKNEIIMGLGIRECCIFGATAVIVGIIFIKSHLPSMVVCYLTAPLVAIATVIAAMKPGGMTPERYIWAAVRSIRINNRHYKYIDSEQEGVVKNGITKGNRKKRL